MENDELIKWVIKLRDTLSIILLVYIFLANIVKVELFGVQIIMMQYSVWGFIVVCIMLAVVLNLGLVLLRKRVGSRC